MSELVIFGDADPRAVEQIRRCAAVEEDARAVLCADSHVGYSQPIGGAVAYRDHVSPSGVGYDIGCGNKAVLTDLRTEDVDVAGVMDEIVRRISFGMGRPATEPADHQVLDHIREAAFTPQRQLYDLAAQQLGTVGAGNHYVDLFDDQQGRLWIGVHFGSRGFGHKTASGFLALAAGAKFEDRGAEGEMDSPPVVFGVESELGQSYIDAMTLAGEYAYAGRDVVCEKVLEILGARAIDEVHNHHNFAWREAHDGEQWWVVRKGCTPAWPQQRGFVGATMGEESVILRGTLSAASEGALRSTVHGAGRVMSRTEAAGKVKRRKFYECNDRDCSYTHTDPGQFACPDHPDARPIKRWRHEQVRPGKIDWPSVQAQLTSNGIELRGGAADEAPLAYKRLDEVLAAHGDTIEVEQRLRPVGVAMAGPDVYDPFKD